MSALTWRRTVGLMRAFESERLGDLMSGTNPYAAPSAELDHPGEASRELLAIGKAMRVPNLAVLVYLIFAMAIPRDSLAMLAFIVPLLMMIVGMYRLGDALGQPVIIRIVLIPLMFVPLLNLVIVLLMVNNASKRLKAGGVKTSLLGVSAAEIRRLEAA